MKKLVVVLVVIGIWTSCDKETLAPSGVQFPETGGFELLSQYNLFEAPMASLTPVEGLIPYDLNTPLFTDYATKLRFVYVPEGKITPYDTLDALAFPKGTVLVKNFYYTLTSGEQRIMETRLLLHQGNGWNAEVYEWNEAQTEATRIIVGKQEQISFQVDGRSFSTTYQIPNKNQCKNCHGIDNKVTPIGPKIGNLNKQYNYGTSTQNQLTKWMEEGILTASNSGTSPKWPDYSDLAEDLNLRARAYLEVNCAHCHRDESAASNSGLNLQYHNYDSSSYGFLKAPVAAGDGSGGLQYDIVKGSAESSILYYRMNSNDVEVRMPELGRTLIDEEGVALIKEWIDTME